MAFMRPVLLEETRTALGRPSRLCTHFEHLRRNVAGHPRGSAAGVRVSTLDFQGLCQAQRSCRNDLHRKVAELERRLDALAGSETPGAFPCQANCAAPSITSAHASGANDDAATRIPCIPPGIGAGSVPDDCSTRCASEYTSSTAFSCIPRVGAGFEAVATQHGTRQAPKVDGQECPSKPGGGHVLRVQTRMRLMHRPMPSVRLMMMLFSLFHILSVSRLSSRQGLSSRTTATIWRVMMRPLPRL